jgi:hypothetical protein
MPIKHQHDDRLATLEQTLRLLRAQTEELHRVAAQVRAESRRYIATTRKDLATLRRHRVGKKR